MSFPSPKSRPLPKQRTQECHPFQVVGVDYAGPIFYRSKNKAISKSNILLFLYSVSRLIDLELESTLTTEVFIKIMKRLITKQGSPKRVYSENVKAFQAGAKWITRINKDKKFHCFLIVMIV